jgi:hypothetical protein
VWSGGGLMGRTCVQHEAACCRWAVHRLCP